MAEEEGASRPTAPETDETEVDTGTLEVRPGAAIEPPPEAGAAEAYHQRARLAEDRLQEVLGAYRRLKNENDQYRDRVARNVERRFNERRERLLLKFIEILDNLDRALEASERSFATEALIEGLILVRSQLLQTLQEEGLERIPVLGLPYNPEFAEAVETQPVDDPEHHHLVVRELLRGYRFEGRVVRHSRVVVGEHGCPPRTDAPAEAAAPPTEPADEAEPEPDESIEDIVSRAQAQEALFPDAFDGEEEEGENGDGDESEDEEDGEEKDDQSS